LLTSETAEHLLNNPGEMLRKTSRSLRRVDIYSAGAMPLGVEIEKASVKGLRDELFVDSVRQIGRV
jgi:hypothetical protein